VLQVDEGDVEAGQVSDHANVGYLVVVRIISRARAAEDSANGGGDHDRYEASQDHSDYHCEEHFIMDKFDYLPELLILVDTL